jgi:hypothetical protein
MDSTSNLWRYNLPIGITIKLYNDDQPYIFYGYNLDQTLGTCFPPSATTIDIGKRIIQIDNIESVGTNVSITKSNKSTGLLSYLFSKLGF